MANTPSVQNTWHINNGILSLRTVMFYFLLNDYQRYSFCRKHFRVSHNLSWMQLKVGTDFIPQTAIVGHAGNLECNSVVPYDCTPFYVELLRTTLRGPPDSIGDDAPKVLSRHQQGRAAAPPRRPRTQPAHAVEGEPDRRGRTEALGQVQRGP